MNKQNENLLESWIRLSGILCNQKLSSEMPYKESLICGILYRTLVDHPEQKLTATDLCKLTRMQKSQMNRTLTNMENKRLISRQRSEEDHRKIFVMLNSEQIGHYHQQHDQLLAMIDRLITKLGSERVPDMIQLFDTISDFASEIIQ